MDGRGGGGFHLKYCQHARSFTDTDIHMQRGGCPWGGGEGIGSGWVLRIMLTPWYKWGDTLSMSTTFSYISPLERVGMEQGEEI